MDKIIKKKYTIQDNLIKLNIEDETVEKVVDFYTEAPFPNYEKTMINLPLITKVKKIIWLENLKNSLVLIKMS